jgi:hypothetical protein
MIRVKTDFHRKIHYITYQQSVQKNLKYFDDKIVIADEYLSLHTVRVQNYGGRQGQHKYLDETQKYR